MSDRPYCDICGPRDECECPDDLDGPILCAHGKDMGDGCAECVAEAELQLAGMFARMLAKIEGDR